ncbi:MAG: ABC transporter ATP-binding protein [Magnetococcales bacterium]|nr:ABC transporter ATP-binding protein [Magnetococcales bacterium]
MPRLALMMEDVSKQYRLGEVGSGTFAHDLNRWFAKILGRPDPLAPVGREEDQIAANGKLMWALRGIDIAIEQGSVVGIIGHNGAGKSTLLKLLSRVTAPTTGRIGIRGRLASLLEVGTGFHPDLTGRENVFLNGAIMGMNRREIQARLDEIVAFAGVAKYIDTPVKRYSSGMHVRLAFAVAAHLEPDILIVDEVLAVGDADFQAKCLGKMEDVSQKSGRTILFVSHNMAAVQRLCPQAILLEQGRVVMEGKTPQVISQYLDSAKVAMRLTRWEPDYCPATSQVRLYSIAVRDIAGRLDSLLSTLNEIRIEIDYALLQDIPELRVAIQLIDADAIVLFSSSDCLDKTGRKMRRAGRYRSICRIPPGLMTVGRYVVQVFIEVPLGDVLIGKQEVQFEINELGLNPLGRTVKPVPPGVMLPILEWQIQELINDASPEAA